jgi:hypothetical protein
MLPSPVLPSFSQSRDYPTLSHCHKPLQLGITVLARCCPRHGRTVVAPPAVRSSRPYTSGHRIRPHCWICPARCPLVRVVPSSASALASWLWVSSCSMYLCGPLIAVASPALLCTGIGCPPRSPPIWPHQCVPWRSPWSTLIRS